VRPSVLSPVTLLVLLLMVPGPATARPEGGLAFAPAIQAYLPGEVSADPPVRARGVMARTDTLDFGSYAPPYNYAVLGQRWTWDNGTADPMEGWTTIDETANTSAYFRRITTASWAGQGNTVAAPIISGSASAWLGVFENEARALCFSSGLGYGNLWRQRLDSPTLQYSGTGGVLLSLKYFNDSEALFDYTKIFLIKDGTEVLLNESTPGAGDGFSGRINVTCNSTCVLTVPPAPWTVAIGAARMGSAGQYTLCIQFESDGGDDDADGGYATTFGAFGLDDVTLTGGTNASFNFEAGLQGWTPAACPGIGSFFAVNPISNYLIAEPCLCQLSGNVVSLHDEFYAHPDGQREEAISNIVDRRSYSSFNQILADWDMYTSLPYPNGVLFRPGWLYYPYECPSTGVAGWSPRVGQDVWLYTGDKAICHTNRNVATDWGVPANCEFVRFAFEVQASCRMFGIAPTVCSGVSDFSPLIDNVRIRLTGAVGAPALALPPGMKFQDAFGRTASLGAQDPADADVTFNLHANQDLPDRLGDSLVVSGPQISPAGTNRWQAKLWLRVYREGPSQTANQAYITWKSAVADGRNIVGHSAPYTFALMDSVESPSGVLNNRFCSQFHETDDDFRAPDQGEANEIVPDGILTPGTKIQYFVTGNYVCAPNTLYYLPDTSGGGCYEFEVLPSYRDVNDAEKAPQVLYVDAANGGNYIIIENALNRVLMAAPPGAPIPDLTNWDRYDYADAASNWKPSLFRGPSGESGATLLQMLGYQMIMVHSGTLDTGAMNPRDWEGLSWWLDAPECGANQRPQGLYLSGDNLAKIISSQGAGFLESYCGSLFLRDTYSDPWFGIPDNDYCVRIEAALGAIWPPGIPMDLWGNWCPERFSFDVLSTSGGTGNKSFRAIGSGQMVDYAQVVNDALPTVSKYRTVVDGYALDHLTRRDTDHPGNPTECPNDASSLVAAAQSELANIVRFALNISDPSHLDPVVHPCAPPYPSIQAELRVADWVNPEPWHAWFGGESGGTTPVQLYLMTDSPYVFCTDVTFSCSINDGQTWTVFGQDQDGSAPWLDTYGTALPQGDGWFAAVPHSLFPPAVTQVRLKAEARMNTGGSMSVETARLWDPWPPSAASINVEDWQIVAQDLFNLLVDPHSPSPGQISVFVEAKQDTFSKGIPGISQQPHSTTHCAPTAAAQCLKYFEGKGDSTIAGGLNDSLLVRALAQYQHTNWFISGTTIPDWVQGTKRWITHVGGSYTVRENRYFTESGAGTWTENDWKNMRNELERCQDVLLAVFWPGGGGHAMTLNSVINTRLPNGRVKVDFKDPWTGQTEWGELDTTTGQIYSLSGAGGGGQATVGASMTICPKENNPAGGGPGVPVWQGPNPFPAPIQIHFPGPGKWFLHIILNNDSGDSHRFIRIVEAQPGSDAPESAHELPRAFALGQNVPNPFRGETVISYAAPKAGRITLEVYDLSGRRVRTLLRQTMAPGFYTAVWDGRDERGRAVAAGVYYIRMVGRDYESSRHMILLR
jgi:hypothetical protein